MLLIKSVTVKVFITPTPTFTLQLPIHHSHPRGQLSLLLCYLLKDDLLSRTIYLLTIKVFIYLLMHLWVGIHMPQQIYKG